MTRSLALSLAGAFIAFASSAATAQTPSKAEAVYLYAGDISVGAPGDWDYLSFDPSASRLYVSHGPEINVIDTASGKVVGAVKGFHDTHGVAVIPALGKGYADSGEDKVLKVFDLTSLKVTKTLPMSEDADGVVYDEVSKRILVVAGDAHNLTIVDPATDTIAKVLKLPGKPEFLAVDRKGSVFINLADKDEVVRVDILKASVTAEWKLDNCHNPAGLAFDSKTNRLFSGCRNSRLAVVDAGTGKVLTNLPIGLQSDGIVVDEARSRAFSANGDGTLTVIAENAGGSISVARTIPTFFTGRNIAIDPASGAIYISRGVMKMLPQKSPTAERTFAREALSVAKFVPLG